MFNFVSVKLNTEHATIDKLVGKLCQLLLECTKLKITISEFVDSLQPILLDKVFLLWESILMKRDFLSAILLKTDVNYLEFSTLNWRFETTVSMTTSNIFKNKITIFL